MIIIDTDGGVDDMLCLLMASRLVPKEIVGISAVFGNVDVDQALRNIIYSLSLVASPLQPVLGLGAKQALDCFNQPATAIHGLDGLGGARAIRPQPDRPSYVVQLDEFASVVARTIDQSKQKVDVLGIVDKLGVTRINRVVLMSGAFFDRGNITDCAEFNAYNDPRALAAVLSAGVPVTLVPLDLCRKVLLTLDRISAYSASTLVDGAPIAAALQEYAKACEHWEGIKGCFPHDAIALLVMLRPDQFFMIDAEVSVDADADKRGCTRVNAIGGSRANARLALGGDLKWVRRMIEIEWLREDPSIFAEFAE
jgi:inosine-uridine nucleoside N-ribohydrolase